MFVYVFARLCDVNVVVRAVDHITYAMGSYAPRLEPYEFVTPVDEWPSGFLVRGHYVTTVKVRVRCSDACVYIMN